MYCFCSLIFYIVELEWKNRITKIAIFFVDGRSGIFFFLGSDVRSPWDANALFLAVVTLLLVCADMGFSFLCCFELSCIWSFSFLLNVEKFVACNLRMPHDQDHY